MSSREERCAGTTKAPPAAARGIDQCWHVAVICAMISFLTNASIRSSGFLYVGIMNEFQVGRGQAAWPICLMGAIANMAGLVAGPLGQKYTPPPVTLAGSAIMCCGIIASSFAPTITWMAITQGVVFGIGSGLVLMTLPVYINQHFEKYRGFALGIAYAGSTSSAFVFPKLLLYLKNTYNFRSSIMIFGAIVSHVIAASLLLKEPSWIRKKRVDDALALKQAKDIFTIEKEATKTTVNSTAFSKTYRDKKTDTNTAANSKVNPWSIRHGLTVLENPMFYAVMLTYVVFGYNFDVFMATIVDFAIDKGTALEAAVGLIPLFSFTDTLGRLFIPLLVDKGYVTRSCLATVNYFWMSLVLFTFPLVRGYYEIMAACMCLSLAIGCSVTMYPALMADYMGIQRLPISYGIVGAVAGPLFVLKPLFIGFFRDHVGCYSNMYRFLSGGVFVLGLVWLAVFLSERRKRKEWKPQPAGATEAILVDGHAVYCNPGFTATQHRRDPQCSTEGRTNGDIECVKACK